MKKVFGLLSVGLLVFMLSGCDTLLDKILGAAGEELAKGAATPTVSLDCETSFEKHYGEEAVLAVNASASDNGELSYQWYKANSYSTAEKDRTAVSGETEATLAVSGNSESDTYYWCKVTNAKNLKTADSWSYAVRVKISNIVEPDADDITSATTWNADYTYYINFDLSVEATLVIPAGTVIKFNKDAYMGTRGNGVINAVGTEEKPIIFTAANDNSVGIAIPKDKTDLKNTTPKAGEWEGVGVDYQGSKFDYCIFQYGGSEYYGTLRLDAKTTVTNCTFKDNASDGGYDCPALNIYESAIKSTVTGNTFYNNDWPLTCPASFTVDTSNVFHKDDLKNTRQLICLDGDVNTPTVWGVTEVPYCFVRENDDVVVTKALTIEDDVVVKFGANASLDIYPEDGGSLTVGNAILTSMQDDEHGGDTNCDGDTTTPDESDWEGVHYSDQGFNNEINKSAKVLYNEPVEE